ncbi:MAG: 50S ribosomal protein L5 [Chloroflexi bacterium]|nr:50S ribosomal protein L5 [Chloroflexota bacterium]
MKAIYKSDVLPVLMQEFSYANVMQAPSLDKINLNIGLGEAVAEAKSIDAAVSDIATISGQRPVITRAKKSISNFKLREGMPIGVTVTLRNDRMWEFFDRMVNAALPRVRDFQGISPNSFDGHGNYSMGIVEQIIFPEVNIDKLEYTQGMNITFVTTAKNDDHARRLLTLMGMPFRTAGAE